MAKVDLKMGTAIVPGYDGHEAGLNSFIDSVMLFVDTVNTEFASATAEQKTAANATVMRFIKTRLTGKARAAVGEDPQNIEDVINKLKNRCGATTSPDVYISKLNQTKQVGDINKFTNEIENLALLLEKAYISENIPVEVATKMATKQGVKALCSGIRSNETKLLLKAGQFSTLSSAIEKAVENETPSSSNQTQLMYFRGQSQRGRSNYRRYNQRGSNPNNRGDRGNYQRNYRGNSQNQNHNTRNQSNYQRGGRSNRAHRGYSHTRIYYASGENPNQANVSTPQQGTITQSTTPQQNTQQQQQPNFLGQIQRFSQ